MQSMPNTSRVDTIRRRFRDLHTEGTFVVPNPWDIGAARLLEHAGFPALATTSSGLAATFGRDDQQLTRDELLTHVTALTAAVDVPVTVDGERGYADSPEGVAETAELLAAAGAAGLSVEDYDPSTGRIEPLKVAAERVAAAAAVCSQYGMVLTGRAENHFYGVDDLNDTITRLLAYREAGALVGYAPGLRTLTQVRQVVEETGMPINVLILPDGPSVPELADAGVRRVSTGGSVTWVAYAALLNVVQELRDGSNACLQHGLTPQLRAEAFRPR